WRVSVFWQIGCFQQIPTDLWPGSGRHLFDANDKHDAGCAGLDRADALADRSRPGGTRILDPCRRLEAKTFISLKHQACSEVLSRKATIEVPQDNLVDVVGTDARVLKRFARHLNNQAFNRLALKLSKGRMCPANNTCCHRSHSRKRSITQRP